MSAVKRLAHVTAITVFCAAPLCNGFWPLVISAWFAILLALIAHDDDEFVDNLGSIVISDKMLMAVWTMTIERAALDPKP